MAAYSVTRAKHATLVISTVDTVTFGETNTGVRVHNRSTTAANVIYFTTNGATPTVAGDNTFCCPAGQSVTVPDSQFVGADVKLISATADPYSVIAV